MQYINLDHIAEKSNIIYITELINLMQKQNKMQMHMYDDQANLHDTHGLICRNS